MAPIPRIKRVIRSLEKRWNLEGKTASQKRRLRYYYRNREAILEENRGITNKRHEPEYMVHICIAS